METMLCKLLCRKCFMLVKLVIIGVVDAVFVYLGLHVPWRKVENGCFKKCFIYPYKNKKTLGNTL